MARPKSATKTIHTAVRLPQDLHEKLSKAGRGTLADEIKSRLEQSFAWDSMDPPTRDLLSATLRMAGLIFSDTHVDWHVNAYLRAALGEAITAYLADRVSGDANLPSANALASTTASSAWLSEGDTAKRAGEKLFGLYKLLRAPDDAMARYQEKLRTDPLQRQADEQWHRERAARDQGRKKP